MNGMEKTKGVLRHALAYAKRGWRVFPCRGKHPLVKGWPDEATTDEDKIREWWAEYPSASVGIVAGKESGLLVLDVDPRNGGDKTLRKHDFDLPPTPTVKTGGGGRHFYFRHPGGDIKNGVNLEPGLDIRTDRGYVVAPPSRHANGSVYEWTKPPEEFDLAATPKWLLDLIRKGKPKNNGKAYPAVGEPIDNGSRNTKLTSLAGTMRRRGMTPEAIEAALMEENAKRCKPPLPDSEVKTIAVSVSSYEPDDGELHTDLGSARRFARKHQDRIRYCATMGDWLIWDGTRWKKDDTMEIFHLAGQFTRSMGDEAASIENSKDREEFFQYVAKSQSRQRIEAFVALARSERDIAVRIDQLDRDPWLLNCKNGTLDLRTGTLRPHGREDLITKCLPLDYKPEAKAPLWKQFLKDVFSEKQDLINYVRLLFGYILSGSIEEHIFPIFWGEGRNGKGTFIDTVRFVLGADYSAEASRDLLMIDRKDSHPTGLMDLKGKKLVVASETNETRMLDEALVKWLTGGDTIRARRLYADYCEFIPTHKLLLITNHKPVIRGTDTAIWARVKLIPFENEFTGKKRDHNLRAKLKEEAEGILAWAVRGCLSWQKSGFDEPTEVRAAVREYRQNSDIVGRFLEISADETNPEARESSSRLYKAYVVWNREANDGLRMSQKVFAESLRLKGFKSTHTNVGSVYVGLRLRPSWATKVERES